MKTIGVLSSMGPQATMDFEALVHAVAQRLLPQHGNSGYLPMLVSYHRALPMLVDEQNRPVVPRQLDPRLLEAVKKLGACADFLVIPSNAPHQFLQELEVASGLKVLSMIDLVITEVRQRGWKYVGVLGFGEPLSTSSHFGTWALAVKRSLPNFPVNLTGPSSPRWRVAPGQKTTTCQNYHRADAYPTDQWDHPGLQCNPALAPRVG